MNEGKQKILNMLEAGIISQEDAYRLLEALGEEIGVKIHCQREEIFTKMHRI